MAAHALHGLACVSCREMAFASSTSPFTNNGPRARWPRSGESFYWHTDLGEPVFACGPTTCTLCHCRGTEPLHSRLDSSMCARESHVYQALAACCNHAVNTVTHATLSSWRDHRDPRIGRRQLRTPPWLNFSFVITARETS